MSLLNSPRFEHPLIQTALFPIASRFVAGDTTAQALAAVRRLNDEGFRATIDVLGEDVGIPVAADRVAAQYHGLIEAAASAGVDANLSLKLSALGHTFDRGRARVAFVALLDHAARAARDPFIRIDMEGYALLNDTLDLFQTVWQTHKNTGPVIQAQLHRSPADTKRMTALGARVRLCKGAYRETASVALRSQPAIRKQYLECAQELLQRGVFPAVATHDPVLIEAVKAMAKRFEVAAGAFEFQMLYGVRPDLQRKLVRDGYNVRIYVPFGSHWARYFRRRVMERRENLFFAVRALVSH